MCPITKSYDLLRVAVQQRKMVKGWKDVKRKTAEVYSFLNQILFCSVCCITGRDKLWLRVHDAQSLASSTLGAEERLREPYCAIESQSDSERANYSGKLKNVSMRYSITEAVL